MHSTFQFSKREYVWCIYVHLYLSKTTLYMVVVTGIYPGRQLDPAWRFSLFHSGRSIVT